MSPEKDTIYHYLYKQIAYCKIPDFQRPYSWSNAQIDSFCRDVEETVAGTKNHYFGTIVYVQGDGFSTIIDGQQRLTTCVLMLIAAYHILQDHPEKASRYCADQIREQFLYDNYGRGGKGVRKIILRTVTTDDDILNKIFERMELSSDEKANKLYKAYQLLTSWLASKDGIDCYIDALDRFEIVRISIKEDDDNPQKVFENINATGEPLSAGDKIRNWALMLNSEDARDHVYSEYWRTIEHSLTRVEKNKQVNYISDFFRSFLMCKKDEFVSEDDAYPIFKEVLAEGIGEEQDVKRIDAFYEDVYKYLDAFMFIKFAKGEVSPAIAETTFNIRTLNNLFCVPFMMRTLVALKNGEVTLAETERTFSHLESYLARRAIVNAGVAGLNKSFPTLYKALRGIQDNQGNVSLDDAYAFYLLSRRGRTDYFPSHAQIETAAATNDFYHYQKKTQVFVLARLSDLSKESSVLHQIESGNLKLSVEHVMPQTLTPRWKNELGSEWEPIHLKWMNTLANLTLTGYNSEYSNKPFMDKKTMENGLDSSPLAINQYFRELDRWNAEAMQARAEWLANTIDLVWPIPQSTIGPIEQSEEDPETAWTPFTLPNPNWTKPTYLWLGESEGEVKTWVMLLERAAKYLDEQHHPELASYATRNTLGFASAPEHLMQPLKIAEGIYIEKHLSAINIVKYLKAAMLACGLSDGSEDIRFLVQKRM